jgi:hypothetical protein
MRRMATYLSLLYLHAHGTLGARGWCRALFEGKVHRLFALATVLGVEALSSAWMAGERHTRLLVLDKGGVGMMYMTERTGSGDSR